MDRIALIDQLEQKQTLQKEELLFLLEEPGSETASYLFRRAAFVRESVYGKDVYLRGLIELTNHCRNDCYYCGIRRSNAKLYRYRLTEQQIDTCCETGYHAGFRTFVLQGGEDPYYTTEKVTNLIRRIKSRYPDCAVTLSLGEKTEETYQAYFDAGADRYLLRQETADEGHYRQLHPAEMSLDNRKKCLYQLKKIGFQVGCGFLVGSPGQTIQNIVEDLYFTKELDPHMVGIGPFLPQKNTPFGSQPSGNLEQTLFLLGLLRLMLPRALLPATTALSSLHPDGRRLGMMAGANVLMPNLTPCWERSQYRLYDKKAGLSVETVEAIAALRQQLEQMGYRAAAGRGDYKTAEKN